jgi:hypothetical protein
MTYIRPVASEYASEAAKRRESFLLLGRLLTSEAAIEPTKRHVKLRPKILKTQNNPVSSTGREYDDLGPSRSHNGFDFSSHKP